MANHTDGISRSNKISELIFHHFFVIGALLTLLTTVVLDERETSLLLEVLNNSHTSYVIFLGLIIGAPALVLKKKQILSFILIISVILALEIHNPLGFQITKILRLFLLFPIFFVKNFFWLNKYAISIFLWGVIILYAFLSYSQGWTFARDNRIVFNANDPNLSSFYVLIAFFIAYRIRNYILILIFILFGVLTLSRNFILAVFVFYLVAFLKHYNVFYFFFKKLKFYHLFLLFNVLILLFSSYMLLSTSFKKTDNNVGRVISINDTSNELRFILNVQALAYIIDSKESFIWGYGKRPWSKAYGGTGRIKMKLSVHNSFLKLSLSSGLIYVLLCTLIWNLCFLKTYTMANFEYFFAFIVFSLFLHNTLSSIYIYSLFFVTNAKLRSA